MSVSAQRRLHVSTTGAPSVLHRLVGAVARRHYRIVDLRWSASDGNAVLVVEGDASRLDHLEARIAALVDVRSLRSDTHHLRHEAAPAARPFVRGA